MKNLKISGSRSVVIEHVLCGGLSQTLIIPGPGLFLMARSRDHNCLIGSGLTHIVRHTCLCSTKWFRSDQITLLLWHQWSTYLKNVQECCFKKKSHQQPPQRCCIINAYSAPSLCCCLCLHVTICIGGQGIHALVYIPPIDLAILGQMEKTIWYLCV